MAEMKNNFLQSKMNKDLDDRILPKGQYRDARNININKSEGADVGALENVKGNALLTNFNQSNGSIDQKNIEIIGLYTDDEAQQIFVFATNFTDSTPTRLGMHAAATNATCYIAMRDLNSSTDFILASGSFLNFSKTHRISGVNLLQDFLYFTDNRNQPRKLNVAKAKSDSSYYNSEDSISVLKINPWRAMRFYNIDSSVVYSTMKNKSDEFLPNAISQSYTVGSTLTVVSGSTDIPISTGSFPASYLGTRVRITHDGSNVAGVPDVVTISNIGSNSIRVTYTGSSFTIPSSSALDPTIITAPVNPDYDANWPGDSQFLKDKFIKFGYRFKFEDNEYSLISPLSPSLYIPLQDGYFLGNKITTTGDNFNQEVDTYESTVVSFMENKIDEADIYIDSPEEENWSVALEKYGIKQIEIIYKDSQDNSFKVVDTIEKSTLANLNSTEFKYIYQSRAAIRTLPESDLTRVADKAPIRAEAQELTGNRLLYGNYVSKLGSIDSNDYRISIGPKLPESTNAQDVATKPYLIKEFQNHTVKQNRSYQVGIIFQDRYGRSSDVILSSLDESLATFAGFTFSGSTVNHPYRGLGDELFQYDSGTNVADNVWPGDSIKLLFSTPIPEATDDPTYAGLYVPIGAVETLQITGPSSDFGGAGFTAGTVASATYDGNTIEINITSVNSGAITGFTVADASEGFTLGQVVNFSSASSTIDCEMTVRKLKNPNPLGWYTFKVVVKQQEQDYYNAYLPGILNRGPSAQSYDSTSDAFIVLKGDNINKIPRDLQEVGPTQSQFSSSVELFGRVEPKGSSLGQDENKNQQYRPLNLPDTAVSIGTLKDLGLETTIEGLEFSTTAGTTGFNLSPFYGIEGNATAGTAPIITFKEDNNTLIAKLSTQKAIGIKGGQNDNGAGVTLTSASNKGLWYLYPGLSIYETQPTFSQLEIFYETPTTGTIKALNKAILVGDVDTPRNITDFVFTLPENTPPNTVCSTDFFPISAGGLQLANANTTCQITSVLTATGLDVTNKFVIEKDSITFAYRIKTAALPNGTFVFTSASSIDNYQFNFTFTNVNLAGTILSGNVSYGPPSKNNPLTNIQPHWNNNSGGDIIMGTQREWDPTGAGGTIDSDALPAGPVLDGKNGAYANNPAQTPFLSKAGLYWEFFTRNSFGESVGTLNINWYAKGIIVNANSFNAVGGLPRFETRNTGLAGVTLPDGTSITQVSGSLPETVYYRLQAYNPWWPYIYNLSSVPQSAGGFIADSSTTGIYITSGSPIINTNIPPPAGAPSIVGKTNCRFDTNWIMTGKIYDATYSPTGGVYIITGLSDNRTFNLSMTVTPVVT